jgi:hypothetical protein
MISTLKKFAITAGAVATGLLGAVSCFAAGEIITLPETAVADLTGAASQIMTDVWVLVAIAVGIPLGFYIIRKVVGLLPKK